MSTIPGQGCEQLSSNPLLLSAVPFCTRPCWERVEVNVCGIQKQPLRWLNRAKKPAKFVSVLVVVLLVCPPWSPLLLQSNGSTKMVTANLCGYQHNKGFIDVLRLCEQVYRTQAPQLGAAWLGVGSICIIYVSSQSGITQCRISILGYPTRAYQFYPQMPAQCRTNPHLFIPKQRHLAFEEPMEYKEGMASLVGRD